MTLLSTLGSTVGRHRMSAIALTLVLGLTVAHSMTPSTAQSARARPDDAYRAPANSGGSLGTLPGNAGTGPYQSGSQSAGQSGSNRPSSDYGTPPSPDDYGRNGPPRGGDGYRGADVDRGQEPYRSGGGAPPPGDYGPTYGQPYTAPPPERYERAGSNARTGEYADDRGQPYDNSYSKGEITNAGGRFFGSITKGLASAIEYTYQKAGRPNGYILGEDAGGAFIGGLRYGEGTLYTKDAGTHKVYWQGPSLGYDIGGEGSKTMVLVYNLRDVSELYERFGGIEGSAYLIGGVSVQFQKRDDVILAPIRTGVGLRLGANVGYLKYTRKPTWNPF